MKVADAIAHVLKEEGVEILFSYPVNPIIEAAAVADIRTIIVRQERIGLHMADAYSRLSSGKKIGVFAMQHGPGSENAFGGVAQAYSESVPILVLPAGYTQFSSRIRATAPNLHKRMGRLYVWVTLLLAGPSGLVLGIYANGGPSSQTAFCLLAVGWMYTTYMAMRSVSRRQIAAHRAWMMRSFALTLSAITLRAWKYVLVWAFHPRPMDVYRVVAWLGWTLNLLVVEAILYHQRQRK